MAVPTGPGQEDGPHHSDNNRGIAQLAVELLEAMVDAFYVVDRDWRVVHINGHACRFWDAEPSTVVGRVLWERFPQMAGSEAERRLRQAAAAGQMVEYEAPSPVAERWFRVRVSPLSGGLTSVYWRDVTGRKEAEDRLRRRDDQLRLAMEVARLGSWEVDVATGKREWSDAARAVMGVPPEIEPSYEAFMAAVHPDDRAGVAEAYQRSHQPNSGGVYLAEYRTNDLQGRERWIAVRGRTLFDEAGRPARMIGVTLDITEHKRAEQAARDGEERFRMMLEALPQIAFVIRADGVAEYYNARFADYVGHAIGTDPAARTAVLHPEDQKRLIDERKHGAAEDREYIVEARMRRHDGVYRWHVIRNSPLRRNGKTYAWLGTAVDIDDIRRVNEELERRVAERTRDLDQAVARLRLSEERHRALFAKAPVPMHALDAERRLVDVNEYWLRLLGYQREEVLGRQISDFYLPGHDALHDERWQQVMRRGELREAERQLVSKSGEIIDALISVRLEADLQGKFVRTITTVVDVTARKRAEAAARLERQLSDLLIDSGTEGIIGLDRELRYTVWNSTMEALSGVPRAKLLGRHVFDMRPDLVGTPIEAAWRATLEGRPTTLRDRPYKFAESGRSGYYDADFAPLYGPDRSIIGAFAFLRDTTERRRIEEQLRQAQKMEAIGQLTGGVAHDFNNLLTVLIGNLDNLQRHIPEQGEPKQMMAALMRAANRAATLTHRLLAFARRQPLEPRPIDVNRLVTGMSDLLRRSLGENITIETVLAGGLWRTLADPNQLESALLNLAVNARDAMPQGGKLTLETANAFLDEAYAAAHEEVKTGQYVMVAVSDTGTGMSRDIIDKAFEPFFTTKETGQGTGLGLPQVYGFVKQSGGHVKIYSELGEGTTVKLYLPRLLSGDAASDGPAEPREPAVEATRETILVVEDDEDVRDYGAGVLRQLGYRVIEAPDGPSALRLLDAAPEIQMLFTDVGLPGGLNGRQLADAARQRRPDLKVLFTTGYARNAIVHQGRLDPGVALIVKPFTTTALALKIRQVLEDRAP